MTAPIGILGLGHALPETVRTNDDPLFGGLRSEVGRELFSGFRERRVLAAGERIEDLAAQAARSALADAGVTADRIERLYGVVSPSEPILPSGLFAVHEALGLRAEAQVIPIHSEFTNFIAGLVCATEAVAAGRVNHALVVVAGAWTRLVDYADAGAMGVGDAAGAVVVGRGARFELVDEVSETHPAWREAMTVRVRTARRSLPEAGDGPRPVFVFESSGAEAFRALSVTVPERLIGRLLARHGLRPADVALVPHQASGALLDAWEERFNVGRLVRSLEETGNATVATIATTLSRVASSIEQEHIVLLGLGVGQNFAAALLRRVATPG